MLPAHSDLVPAGPLHEVATPCGDRLPPSVNPLLSQTGPTVVAAAGRWASFALTSSSDLAQ